MAFQPSFILCEYDNYNKRYIMTVRGHCLGGFRNAYAGKTAEEAAGRLMFFISWYGLNNSLGYFATGPKDVTDLIDQNIMPLFSQGRNRSKLMFV